MRQQRPTSISEAYSTSQSLKQSNTELGFHLRNSSRHCRLRQVQSLRRPREGASGSDLDERFEPGQINPMNTLHGTCLLSRDSRDVLIEIS